MNLIIINRLLNVGDRNRKKWLETERLPHLQINKRPIMSLGFLWEWSHAGHDLSAMQNFSFISLQVSWAAEVDDCTGVTGLKILSVFIAITAQHDHATALLSCLLTTAHFCLTRPTKSRTWTAVITLHRTTSWQELAVFRLTGALASPDAAVFSTTRTCLTVEGSWGGG